MRHVLLTTLCILGLALSVQAQKIGYVNSTAILEGMAEVKAAESDIVTYRTQQEKLLESKVTTARGEYEALVKGQQEGTLTPKQIEEKQVALQKKQEELQQMEANIQQELLKRREAKFQPIFDRVNGVIETIAQNEGYTYVFDATAAGVIVYADESMDLTDKVKSALAAN